MKRLKTAASATLPGATYAIGFVRGYADYLGLDSQEIVRRFKQENGDLARGNHLVFPSVVSEGGIPTGALLGFAVVIAIAVYFGWHWYQGHEQTPAETTSGLPDRLSSLIHESVGNGTEIVPVSPSVGEKPSENTATSALTAVIAAVRQPQEAAPPPADVPTPPAGAVATPAEPALVPPPQEAAHPGAPAGHADAKSKDKTVKLAEASPTPSAPTSPPAPDAGATPAPVAEAPVAEHAVGHGRVLLQAQEKCWIKIMMPVARSCLRGCCRKARHSRRRRIRAEHDGRQCRGSQDCGRW